MPTGWLIAFTIIYFVSGAIMCPIAKALADDKGYNGILLAIATVFFSGIGFLCACALPDKKGKDYSEEIRSLTKKVEELTAAVKTLSEEKKISAPPVKPEEPPVRTDTIESLYRRKDLQGDVYRRPVTKKPPATANLIFKDGRLACSACGGKIGFNDKTCPSCGASIVPADDSEGGFFKKK